jgi:hypothetical protein
MRAAEIQARLRKTPFEPFRLLLSDGSFYDVPHPELALVSKNEVVIAIATRDRPVPDRLAFCDPLHVTRLEPLEGKAE